LVDWGKQTLGHWNFETSQNDKVIKQYSKVNTNQVIKQVVNPQTLQTCLVYTPMT